METTPIQPAKPATPFKSWAQMKRCITLIPEGKITAERFDADLVATNLDSIPWRVGPAKEGDGEDLEFTISMRERKIQIVAGETPEAILVDLKGMADSQLRAIASNPNRPDVEAAIEELERRHLSKEGLQEGSEGLEAGRDPQS